MLSWDSEIICGVIDQIRLFSVVLCRPSPTGFPFTSPLPPALHLTHVHSALGSHPRFPFPRVPSPNLGREGSPLGPPVPWTGSLLLSSLSSMSVRVRSQLRAGEAAPWLQVEWLGGSPALSVTPTAHRSLQPPGGHPRDRRGPGLGQ